MSAEIPTRQLRRERAELGGQLDEIEQALTALTASHDSNEQLTLMHRVVVLFSVDVEEQAHWEERVFYPHVEAMAGGPSVTAPFRADHAHIERVLRELVAMRDADTPDVAEFVFRSYQLLDLVRKHVEREDRALLPYVATRP